MINILNSDCLDALKTLLDDSIDSLVTDPPAGISFMGKAWDSDKGGRSGWIAWMTEVMKECHRVLKPGAHGLVWAIPRTSHWTATALEDAGFEVRDVITHLFGQGFPKSLDISKAIDKSAGAEREVIGEKLTGKARTAEGWQGGQQLVSVTAPATASAKEWEGWGTALKPASEHWILIRKPCSEKTVAANVLKWGVGGLNIDGSRVGTEVITQNQVNLTGGGGRYIIFQKDLQTETNAALTSTMPGGMPTLRKTTETTGRFPANLVLSHSDDCEEDQCSFSCAVKALDVQSGALKFSYATNEGKASSIYGGKLKAERNVVNKGRQGDSGGASRFFYCAKISGRERGEDNKHPTVKPKKLMGYLIRMITPPGGKVLDPFMGSGSTGIAAKECGFKFVGIEKEKDYFEISKARIGA